MADLKLRVRSGILYTFRDGGWRRVRNPRFVHWIWRYIPNLDGDYSASIPAPPEDFDHTQSEAEAARLHGILLSKVRDHEKPYERPLRTLYGPRNESIDD